MKVACCLSLSQRLAIMLCGMSIAVLSSMNIERYIAILHPIAHRTQLTKERLLMLAVLLWSGYIATFIVSFANSETTGKMLVALRFCFILFTIWTYVKIFLAMRKSRRTFALNNTISTTTNTSPLESSFNRKKQFLKKVKLAKSFILVIITNSICSVPQLIMAIMFYNGVPTYLLDIFNIWSITFVLLNSSLNSLLFFWFNPKLRFNSIAIVKKHLQIL